jgi:hypothetical protein
MAGKIWTTQEEEILRRMAAAGKNSTEISQVLVARTPNGIEKKAREFGVSLTDLPEINMEAFKQFLKAEGEIKCL